MQTTPIPLTRVRAYLDSHFLEEGFLLQELGLPRTELRARQAAGLLPGPSYVLTHAMVSNFIFGRFAFVNDDGLACDGCPGSWRYYPRTYANWIEELAAAGVHDGDGLRAYHEQSLRTYLASHAKGLWDDANPETVGEVGFQAVFENQAMHWRAGTYGVCVRPPQSFASLFRKLTAVRRLEVALSENTSEADLKAARSEYDIAVMPFSPHELSFSSRRRLGCG